MVTAVTVTVCKTFSIVFLGTFQINAYLCRRQIAKEPIMCTYKDIDLIVLPNGQTVSEANFSSDMVLHMIENFRAAGFKISLCYFGLLNEDESVSRVIHRVQTGGHDVVNDVIRFNFHVGLKNTQQHLRLFDNLTFIDGNSDYGHIIALHISKSLTHKVIDNPPLWFKEQFEKQFEEL